MSAIKENKIIPRLLVFMSVRLFILSLRRVSQLKSCKSNSKSTIELSLYK